LRPDTRQNKELEQDDDSKKRHLALRDARATNGKQCRFLLAARILWRATHARVLPPADKGLGDFIGLLMSEGEAPLLLQIKEAYESVEVSHFCPGSRNDARKIRTKYQWQRLRQHVLPSRIQASYRNVCRERTVSHLALIGFRPPFGSRQRKGSIDTSPI
jgi:hypothetical protein